MRTTLVACAMVVAGLVLAPVTIHTQNHLFRAVLLGTGTPVASPARLGPSTLVEAGVERLVFDVGRDVIVRLDRMWRRREIAFQREVRALVVQDGSNSPLRKKTATI